MSSFYYSSLARLKLALRSDALSGVRGFLKGFPPARWVAQTLIPEHAEVWVQVQSGFAQGLWLRLNPTLESDYWLGDREPVVQEELRRQSRAGATFYDIGAHAGFFSLAIARAVGPQGKVFAFEPDGANGARLREHAARNHLLDRVQVVEAAVWSSNSEAIRFRRGGHGSARGGVWAEGVAPVLADGEAVDVRSITLDAFVQQGHPLPDVVKIDVEGAECEVLKGGEQLFSRAKPALICEVHHSTAAGWITAWLAAKGYTGRWHVPEESFPRVVVAEGA